MGQSIHGWQTIESVKKGDFFKRKYNSNTVFVKQGYNRFDKKYSANKFDDISDFMHFKKGTLVYTNFEF